MKEILRILKKKGEGKFTVKENRSGRPLLKGCFRNAARHGKWSLAQPAGYSKESSRIGKKVLLLRYKDGVLVSMRYFEPTDRSMEDRFTRRWRYFYEEKIPQT